MLVTSTLQKNDGGGRTAPEPGLYEETLADEAWSRGPAGRTSPGARSDAVLIVSRLGVVKFVSESTRQLVTSYVGPFTDGRLPASLVASLEQSWQPRCGVPFFVDRDGQRLMIRPLLTSDPDEIVLLVQEQRYPVDQPLRRHGLTPREHEVLWWVTEGKTNPEIGIILGRSARTVQIHLNRVYRKLGVETRTAAAALALRASLVTGPIL